MSKTVRLSRRLAWLTAAAGLLLSSAASAGPSAAAAGPDAVIGHFYIQDLKTIYEETNAFRENLKFVGLGDEGMEYLSALSKAELGLDLTDAAALEGAGFDLSAGASVFLSSASGSNVSVVFGSKSDKAVRDTLKKLTTKLSGESVRIKKRKGKLTTYGFQNASGEPLFDLVFAGGLAHAGPPNSLGYIASGSASGQGVARFVDTGSPVEFGAWVDFQGFAEFSGDRDFQELAQYFRDGQMTMHGGASTMKFDATLSAGPGLAPDLARFVPSYKDVARQTALFREFDAPPFAMYRLLLPMEGFRGLLEDSGLLTPEAKAEARKELGLDLETDLLDVFLGDFTVVMPTGLADLRVEMTVADAKQAEDSYRTILDVIGRETGADVQTHRIDDATFLTKIRPPGEEGRFVTFHIYWGFRGGRMLVGLTPLAMAAPQPATQGRFLESDAGAFLKSQIERPSAIVGFGNIGYPLTDLQDIVTVIRSFLGEDGQAIMDILDWLMLSAALNEDSMVVVDVDANGFAVRSSSRSLSLSPGADPASPIGLYARSLQELFSGAVPAAKKTWNELATTHSTTREGQRAARNLYHGSSLASMYLLMLPSAMLPYLMMSARYDSSYPEPVEYAEVEPPPPPEPCLMWADLACFHHGDASKECKRANKYRARKSGKFKKSEKQRCALELMELRGY